MTSCKKLIFLPIETKNRELHSKLLLISEALNSNYIVILGSKHRIKQAIEYMPPGVVFHKDHSSGTTEFLKKCKNRGCLNVILDEEAVTFHPDNIFKKVRIDQKNIKYLDQFLFLNEMHQGLYRRLGVLENLTNYSISGNPRFDFGSEKLSVFIDKLSIRILKKYKKFILVNTNFAQGNHVDGSGGFLRRLKASGHLVDAELKEYYEHLMRERGQLFHEFTTNVIPHLSRNFPNLNILVRTHPEESDKTYKDLTKQYSNVIVKHEGSVYPWIKAAELVIHSGCTTGLEASILKIPNINYNFLKKKNVPYSQNVGSVADLCQQVKIIMEGGDKITNQLNSHRLYFNNNFPNKAAIEIIEIIKSLDIPAFHVPVPSQLKSSSINFQLFLLEKYRKMRSFFPTSGMNKSSFKKFNSLSAAECTAILNKMSSVGQKTSEFTARNLMTDLIIFKPKD